ncbi:hypothetical protein BJY04DRAFT_165455 [Aspergillus karnatakaensis]|uniref:uncharacterized protein n=1 Tax=Aspergillus karnatakaensis TaxID=1810916 RepID=UPI003CCDF8A9
MFSQEADPLLTCSRAGTPLLRIVLLSTFAISAHLISRDFHAEYAYLARMCWSEVQRSMKTFPNDIHLLDETSLDHIRIMCLIAVNELIGPNRSRVSMDLLNASQLLLTMAPQTQQNDHMVSVSFAQLGLFLSQLEASLCLHFQRPSMQYETLRTLSSQPTTWLDTCMRISQLFQRSKKPTEAELTSIPEMPKFPASRLTTEIVSTYLELHPLFTADLSWLCAENVVCPCSSELLLHVSSAARIYIEHLYSKKSAVCIWMTLERVLKSGFVWIVWTIYQLRAGHDIDVADLTRPLTQCDHVLSVLVERWKPGLPYYESWDIIRQTTLSVIHDAINPR